MIDGSTLDQVVGLATGEIMVFHGELADIWISIERQPDVLYHYGGTRLVAPDHDDEQVLREIRQLSCYESSLKNRLINRALQDGSADEHRARLPPSFLRSLVGGARCIIRPRTAETHSIVSNPAHPSFAVVSATILEYVGLLLNQLGGLVKLTPDFGRYSRLADTLFRYTPHVLGVARENGGCGGKSSYSAIGIIAALRHSATDIGGRTKVTMIGSHGAMGSHVTGFLVEHGPQDLALCDLAYDAGVRPDVPGRVNVLPGRFGQFTEPCLVRGDLIIATTVGRELENSPVDMVPAGTCLMLAHNLSMPTGQSGVDLAQGLAARGILVLPGQVLTLGGALTSRLEWFTRQARSGEFDKGLAHQVVGDVIGHILSSVLTLAHDRQTIPYTAMVEYAFAA